MSTILIAESDPALRAEISAILQPLGFDMEWVESIHEAQQILASRDCCLVIANLELKDGSGLSLWSQHENSRRLPPFLLTVRGAERLFSTLLDIGVDCPPFSELPLARGGFQAQVKDLLSAA